MVLIDRLPLHVISVTEDYTCAVFHADPSVSLIIGELQDKVCAVRSSQFSISVPVIRKSS